MVKLKDSSVNIDNLNSNLMQFLQDMSSKFDGIVVTAGNDGFHKFGSRHFLDKAIDIGARSSEPTAYADFKKYVLEGKTNWHLPEKFAQYQIEDILDEDNHIHIELPLTLQEAETIKKNNIKYIAIIVVTLGALFGGYKYIKYKKIL